MVSTPPTDLMHQPLERPMHPTLKYRFRTSIATFPAASDLEVAMDIAAVIASIVIAVWLSANAVAFGLLLWNGHRRHQ
jgi:hypothetical protein